MKHLAKDKDSKVVEDAGEKVESLLFTFNQHLRNKYDRYYYVFVACEASNLLIVIAQLLLTNSFLGRRERTSFSLDLQQRSSTFNDKSSKSPRVIQ